MPFPLSLLTGPCPDSGVLRDRVRSLLRESTPNRAMSGRCSECRGSPNGATELLLLWSGRVDAGTWRVSQKAEDAAVVIGLCRRVGFLGLRSQLAEPRARGRPHWMAFLDAKEAAMNALEGLAIRNFPEVSGQCSLLVPY